MRATGLRFADHARAGGRLLWVLVDQAMSSLTNFGLAVLVAHQAAAAEFGTFGLALSLYVSLLWASRALCTEPFAVRYGSEPLPEQDAAARGATGAALAVGLVAGVVVFVIGLAVEPGFPVVLGTMSLAMPALLTQDAFRYVLFSQKRVKAAAAIDLLWAGVQFGIAAILIVSYRATPATLVAAFGTGAAVSAFAAAWWGRIVPSLARAPAWLARYRRLSVPSFLELAVVTGTIQVTMLAIAAVAGLAAVGELRGSLILLGPLSVLFVGVFVAALPEAVRRRDRSPAALERLVAGLGVGMVLVTVGWSVVLVLVPSGVGTSILGSNWQPARHLLPAIAGLTAGNACALAAVIGLRATGAAVRCLRARLLVAPAMLVGGVVGATQGAYGAALGLAVASWLDALVTWTAFRRAISGGHAPPVVSKLETSFPAAL